MLERHAATSQAFIPFGKAGGEWDAFTGEKGLKAERGGGMVVVGCLPGVGTFAAGGRVLERVLMWSLRSADGQPDLSTLKVFVSSPAQGVCYHAGIWRTSTAVLPLPHLESWADPLPLDPLHPPPPFHLGAHPGLSPAPQRHADHSVVSFSHADYAAIDTQITTDSSLLIDCEIIRKQPAEESFASVQLPDILGA